MGRSSRPKKSIRDFWRVAIKPQFNQLPFNAIAKRFSDTIGAIGLIGVIANVLINLTSSAIQNTSTSIFGEKSLWAFVGILVAAIVISFVSKWHSLSKLPASAIGLPQKYDGLTIEKVVIKNPGVVIPIIKTMQSTIFLMLGLIVLGLVILIFSVVPKRTTRLMGDFKVAVVSLSTTTSDSKELGQRLAASAYGNTKDHLPKEILPFIEILPPNQSYSIEGSTFAERQKNVAMFAERVNADIVLFGEVTSNPNEWIIIPEIYVKPSLEFHRLGDIGGRNALGTPIFIPKNDYSVFPATYSKQLADRYDALIRATYTLGRYATEDFDPSLVERLKSEWQLEPDNRYRLALLYLFMGNISYRKHALVQANEMFEEAINLDPNLARALVARGTVTYDIALDLIQNKGSDSFDYSRLDRTKIAGAITYYDEARKMKSQPLEAEIEVKASKGLGFCYLLLRRAGDASAATTAMMEFLKVTGEYEKRTDTVAKNRIIEYAAQSYHSLAVLAKLSGNANLAIDYYNKTLRVLDVTESAYIDSALHDKLLKFRQSIQHELP